MVEQLIQKVLYLNLTLETTFLTVKLNPIPTGGALLGPNDLKQSGISTVLWLESPKFMTLFISVSVWSQWSYFWKKSYEILKNWKKKNFTVSTPKGPPFGKKIQKSKNLGFFPKNHTFSTWIWILHVLSFLLRYITSVLLKIFKFSFFLLWNFHWLPLSFFDH